MELDDFQQRLRRVIEPLLEALLLSRPEDPAAFVVKHLGGGAVAEAGAGKFDSIVAEILALRQAGGSAAEGAAATRVQAIQRGRVARQHATSKRVEVQESTAATRVQSIQRGKVARAEVAAKKVEVAEEGAATKMQALQRGKAARAEVAAKKAAPTPLELAQALADQEAERGKGSSALDKLRSVVRGRSRQVASMFISTLKKEEEDDDSDDERYSAGTAWLRQRDLQMAAELAQRLLDDELANGRQTPV